MTGIQPSRSLYTWIASGARILLIGLRFNATNSHLPRLNSLFRVPGTEAVDAFSVSWKGENNWLVPPVYCIISAVQHLLVCGAVGTLVIPYWPSNAFWPFLFATAAECRSYVVASIYFPNLQGFLPSGVIKIHSLLPIDLAARWWQ